MSCDDCNHRVRSESELRVRNPWPGQGSDIVSSAGTTVVKPNSPRAGSQFSRNVCISYSLERWSPTVFFSFLARQRDAAQTAKTLGAPSNRPFPKATESISELDDKSATNQIL